MKTLTKLLLVYFCTGCTSSQTALEVEALLKQPSPETRVMLEKALGHLVNSQPIKIADNAFIDKSTVLVERTRHVNYERKNIDGLSSSTADSFTLLKQGEVCFLRHNQSEKEVELPLLKCEANEAKS